MAATTAGGGATAPGTLARSEEQVAERVRERRAAGKAARARAPLAAHADFSPDAARDPVALLFGQDETRVQELVPVRHERMAESAFAFFRGSALAMAADLAGTPTSGIRVQLCGDAHLANFGAYASPERRLVFDLNDFDETLPGPFEWDVKRLVASLAVAGRANGFAAQERARIVTAAAAAYRQAMREFAEQPMLAVWYSSLDIEAGLAQYSERLEKGRLKRTQKMLVKARRRDSTQALGKLTTVVDGKRRIVSLPPLVVPVEELFADTEASRLHREIEKLVEQYLQTLSADRRHLMRQFRLVHMARKVVGVGSVGTRAWILLFEGDDGEPLFLQAKEAQDSVLARYVGKSAHDNQGQRVVAGQKLMQAASDIFLGWQRTRGLDGVDRDYYLRQLRDWKLSAPIEEMVPSGMEAYAQVCAWTLARAHARSGDRVEIAGYLGGKDGFDRAMVEFAERYADITELDHAAFVEAVGSAGPTS